VRKGGFTCPAAGKTGTTDNFRDAWLVGYTPTLATAVWIGYPNAQQSMYNVEGVPQVNGGSLPTDIWTKFMKAAIGNRCKDFPDPKNPFVSKPFTGKYAEEGKAEGDSYTDDLKKKKKEYTEGKKKTPGGGGGGNTTPQQTPEEPETQAPVEAPGGAGPGQ
jgi:penicillin-binding protein 1A